MEDLKDLNDLNLLSLWLRVNEEIHGRLVEMITFKTQLKKVLEKQAD